MLEKRREIKDSNLEAAIVKRRKARHGEREGYIKQCEAYGQLAQQLASIGLSDAERVLSAVAAGEVAKARATVAITLNAPEFLGASYCM